MSTRGQRTCWRSDSHAANGDSCFLTPPTIASPAVKSATIGQKYSYQVKTNAGSGQEITFLLGAAPAGMSINASTGLVTWVPNVFQKGSKTVTVLARDQFGDTTQQTFSISVSGVSTPYNPFAPTNRRLVIVGPVRANWTSAPRAASSPQA